MDRNFTRITIIIGLLIWYSTQLVAQDIHFTQFYHSPLTLNPAMTGNIEGKYRINIMYRTQWTNISSASIYQTPSASFDINLGKLTARNSWGIGGMIFNDRTASGLTNLTMLLGAGYHLNLDQREKHYLSGGIQIGLIQKRIDLTQLTFESQYNPNYVNPSNADDSYFDPSLPREDFETTSISNPDVRLGLTWSSYLDETVIKLGFAYMHVLNPNEGLYTFESPLPPRLVAHGNFKIPFGSVFIRPNVLYMNQAGASQINAGGHLGYMIGDGFEAYIGGGIRLDDAVLAMFGLNFKGFQLGLSYDVNTSILNAVSNNVGAYELSLTYSGASQNRVRPVLPAIRFY